MRASPAPGKTLCIVGGGLSSLIVLHCLSRKLADSGSQLAVIVIDQQARHQFGRGVGLCQAMARTSISGHGKQGRAA